MMLSELVRSCSHEKVAEAAVASIGPGFRRMVEEAARSQGLTLGGFAASRVRNFARKAEDQDWLDLATHLNGADMPILAGLRYILESELDFGMPRVFASGELRERTSDLRFGCQA